MNRVTPLLFLFFVLATPQFALAAPSLMVFVNGQYPSTTINQGEHYYLAWSMSSDAVSCHVHWVGTAQYTNYTGTESGGNGNGTGDYDIPPTGGEGPTGLIGSYTFTCADGNGDTTSTTVTVDVYPPIVALNANYQGSLTIPPGGTYTLYWDSANASSCTLYWYPSNGQPNGSSNITPAWSNGSTQGNGVTGMIGTYTYVCNGWHGEQASKSVTITQATPPASCAVSLSPNPINQGSGSTLSWSSSNANSWVYINSVGYVGASGATGVAPSSSTDYSCYAQGSGGSDGWHSAVLTVYASCTFNGSTVTHGSSVTGYLASTVPYGSSCTSQTRICSNGTLSGSYAYSSCSVTSPSNCTLGGVTVANHGQTITAYTTQTAPSGQICSAVSQSRTCTNGTLSGSSSYQYTSCACTPTTVYSCSPQNVVRTVTNASCAVTVTNPYATCTSPAFCSAGSSVCLYPPVDFVENGDLTGHLYVAPQLIPQGLPVTLYWNVSNATCTVSGNSQTFTGASSGSGGRVTGNINQQQTFTLRCTGFDGSTVNETKTVNVLPIFGEF